MSAPLDRAFLLFEQSRHDLAEQEVRQELSANPDNASAHALLALCLAERSRYDEALQEAQLAIHLAPDLPLTHYALASIYQDRKQLDEASAAIQEAIRLDGGQADYHALLASIRFEQESWPEALAAAERGLALEPEHVISTNLRGMALAKMGRGAEAEAAIESALSRDPQNAVTHANQGWLLLRHGDHVKALDHFRMALQIDPDFDMARQGILEALKARYRVYHLLLKFFVWMAGQSGKAQWALILGGFICYWLLQGLIHIEPNLAPFIWVLLTVYLLFGVLAWTAYPLFNLLLKLNPLGRLALNREQAIASNWVGGCLLASLVAFGVWLVTQERDALLASGVFGVLTLPLAGIFRCRAGLPRRLMVIYTGGVAAAGLIGLVLRVVGGTFVQGAPQYLPRILGLFFVDLFVIGAFFSGLVTIGLMMLKPRR